jgi:hypothetical protein
MNPQICIKQKNYNMMRIKNLFPVLVFFILALFQTSCQKENDVGLDLDPDLDLDINLDSFRLSEIDVAKIIEFEFQGGAGGLRNNLRDLTGLLLATITSGNSCDSLFKKKIERDSQSSPFTGIYTSNINFEISCGTFNLPQVANFSTTTSSTYSTSEIEADNEGVFTGTVSRIQLGEPSLTVEGNYNRSGTQVLNFANQQIITSILNLDLTDIDIKRLTREIKSGSGIFSFSGNIKDKDFLFDGTILFTGNQTATLTINDSNFNINWN